MKVLKVIIGIFIILVVITYFVFQMPTFGGKFEAERWERMQKSPEFIDGRFENTPPQNTDTSILNNIKPYTEGQIREPQIEIPVIPLTSESLNKPPIQGLKAIWFGHATTMIEIDGIRVMTDPILSEYASPFNFGPKRFHPPPIKMEDLSHIDAVVVSHDHYDHLDMRTVQHLAKQGTHFYVGLGIGAHLEHWDIPKNLIHEMDWWETADVKGIKIHCTPSRHYSGRKKMDNSTLWSSWTVKGPKHSFYFSGDTGYSPHFSEIKNRLGAIDLTILKVGAYGSTWLDIHMDPESAIKAHLDLEGKTMLPVHWATFNLAYHSWEEPIVRSVAAASEKNLNLITPRVGEVFIFGEKFSSASWWR